MRNLNRENLVNILYGATILGTGGGGSLERGIEKVDSALSDGKRFNLVTFDDLSPDDMIGTPYSCGAISPLTEEERKKYERLPDLETQCHVMSIGNMEKFLNKPIKAIVSTELGGGNTAAAFYAGAMADKYILDADPAGRSVPGLQHSTYYLKNVPIYPMSLVNKFGESAIITNVFDDERAEDWVRALAVVSQNSIAVCDHVQPASVLKEALIVGAISYSERIGEAFLETKSAQGDYAAAVCKEAGGKFIAKGKVKSNEWRTESGYTFGTMEIESGADIYRIWYQNENIIMWKNSEYFCTVPDLICVFNDRDKMPQLNPYAEAGCDVSIVILPAPKEWTTPRGLEVFGPRSFGHNIDWLPFCG
jgi:DUF917 family protein